ncbi:hypothetical protein [Rhodohalobacter sp.]|uniref:hypothetical protein n=1 Tax=Rhodohalobacter sp. TaxID=1974210 RepID=UPI002ACD374E|nr:hypothetical protein [Rhodohalobacter sp.]MDZ7758537.1 hypothetical protein [Rhodohalobacter sp.]
MKHKISITLDSETTFRSADFFLDTDSIIGREFNLSTALGSRVNHHMDGLTISVDDEKFNAIVHI